MFADTFIVDKRNGSTVDVTQNGVMLKVVCRFPAKTQFDSAINAQLNDQTSRKLFLEGLIRYFKGGPNGEMQVSGQHVLKVQKDGNFLSYEFAVPRLECKVVPKRLHPRGNTNTVSASDIMAKNQVIFASITNRMSANSASMMKMTVPSLIRPNMTNNVAAVDCAAMVRASMERMTNSINNTTKGVVR